MKKKNIKLDCVDCWDMPTDETKDYTMAFLNNLEPIWDMLDISVIQNYSTEASKLYEDNSLDFVFIDGDHSYEGVKIDFDLYSNILSDRGIIAIHDTDKEYEKGLIISEDAKKDYHKFDGPSTFIEELGPEWKLFNFFNEGILKSKPSSTGLTLIQHA